MSAMAQSIGFIGLGAMGLPMAKQLLQAGFQLRGFDVSAHALKALAEAGGEPTDSPAVAAEGADLLVLMVATAEQVVAVLDGPNGALPSLAEGATVVLHSTVPPTFSKALGERLAARNMLFLDAPVSGGVVGAEAGSLSVMASGTAAAFDACEAMLAAVSARVYRLGEAPGLGSSVKMINQLLAGVHIVSAAEAMAFGTRVGADPNVLYDIICNSAGGSWMFQNRVPRMLKEDPEVTSAVEIFVKDLGIVLDTGRELRFPLPLSAVAHQQFLAASAAGLGREDDSLVSRVYERLTGVDIPAAARRGEKDAEPGESS